MDIELNIIQDKADYYELAQKYLRKIASIDLGANFQEIIPKSIAVLVDHDFIVTPCIEIKLKLLQNQKEVGNYFLYIDKEKQFLDEFLILK